jgi:hypothetical protein
MFAESALIVEPLNVPEEVRDPPMAFRLVVPADVSPPLSVRAAPLAAEISVPVELDRLPVPDSAKLPLAFCSVTPPAVAVTAAFTTAPPLFTTTLAVFAVTELLIVTILPDAVVRATDDPLTLPPPIVRFEPLVETLKAPDEEPFTEPEI